MRTLGVLAFVLGLALGVFTFFDVGAGAHSRPAAERARFEIVVAGGAMYRLDTWSGAVEICVGPGGPGVWQCERILRPAVGEP